MVDFGSKGCPEQESVGYHYGTLGLGEFFSGQKRNGRHIYFTVKYEFSTNLKSSRKSVIDYLIFN